MPEQPKPPKETYKSPLAAAIAATTEDADRNNALRQLAKDLKEAPPVKLEDPEDAEVMDMRDYLYFLRHTVLWAVLLFVTGAGVLLCLTVAWWWTRPIHGEWEDERQWVPAAIWFGGAVVSLAGALSAGWAWRRRA